MNFKSIATIALVLLSVAAGAQDLKPVKDKATKKFGYQAKDKSWVIEPSFDKAKRFSDGYAIVEVQGQEGMIDESGSWILRPEYSKIGKFDKSGLCEVTVKKGREKSYGLADRQGRIVIPAECSSVSVISRENLINARKQSGEEFGGAHLWGVYTTEGEEVFPPQFNSQPSWHNGSGIAESALTGLSGLIGADGTVLLPFDNLKISASSGSYEVLTKDFSTVTLDSRLQKTDELRSPGSIIPYDPMDDDVRLAAWHAGCIGTRLHSNNLLAASVTRDASGRSAIVSTLPLEWGRGRFVRLEPEADPASHPGSMEHPYTGRLYTLRALMYEADGSYVGVASDWGWIEGEFDGGIIYNAEGEQQWIVFEDINFPARRHSTSIPLRGYRSADNSSVVSGLGLGSADLSRLSRPSGRADRIRNIIEGENVGVNSYLWRSEPLPSVRRSEEKVMRSPVFRHPYVMGEAVNCKTRLVEDGVEVKLSDRLICEFTDKFEDPYYKMEGEEEIFWGPWNRRTVMLSLEASDVRDKTGYLADDVYNTGLTYKVVICLFDEDGRYLRTLGEAPAPDYVSPEIMVFEKLGIALINHGRDDRSRVRPGTDGRYGPTPERMENTPRTVTIKGKDKLPPLLSALEAAAGASAN